MNNITYLNLIKWAYQVHFVLLVMIKHLAEVRFRSDEFLEECIISARYLITRIEEDIQYLRKHKNF